MLVAFVNAVNVMANKAAANMGLVQKEELMGALSGCLSALMEIHLGEVARNDRFILLGEHYRRLRDQQAPEPRGTLQ